MKKVGITGGIGSGKSRVGMALEGIGYPVYYADARAKALMTESEAIREGVIELFGKEAYLPDGQLNRILIGGIVFKDKEKLNQLNAVVHPETGRDFKAWATQQEKEGHQLVFKEAAILFESGAYKHVDLILAVYAPKQIRLHRAMQRDGADEDAILQRMNRQWPEQEKMSRADFVLYNDGVHIILPQLLEIISHMKSPKS